MSVPSEHVEQVTFVSEFRRQHPGVRIFAVPNGGHRHKLTARKMQSEGVCRGVPDLFIPAWFTWVEMKRQKGGRISKEQADWITYLGSAGYAVIVGYGWRDAIEKVNQVAASHSQRQLAATPACDHTEIVQPRRPT